MGLISLPAEITQRIILFLDPLDVCSVSCTCTSLHQFVGESNALLWKELFLQHFDEPQFPGESDKNGRDVIGDDGEKKYVWRNELERRIKARQVVQNQWKNSKIEQVTPTLSALISIAITSLPRLPPGSRSIAFLESLFAPRPSLRPHTHNRAPTHSLIAQDIFLLQRYPISRPLSEPPKPRYPTLNDSLSSLLSILGGPPFGSRNDLGLRGRARETVYDLNNYGEWSSWGPFLPEKKSSRSRRLISNNERGGPCTRSRSRSSASSSSSSRSPEITVATRSHDKRRRGPVVNFPLLSAVATVMRLNVLDAAQAMRWDLGPLASRFFDRTNFGAADQAGRGAAVEPPSGGDIQDMHGIPMGWEFASSLHNIPPAPSTFTEDNLVEKESPIVDLDCKGKGKEKVSDADLSENSGKDGEKSGETNDGCKIHDWAGVESDWTGTYAFLDYHDFHNFNFGLPKPSLADYQEAVGDMMTLDLKLVPGPLRPAQPTWRRNVVDSDGVASPSRNAELELEMEEYAQAEKDPDYEPEEDDIPLNTMIGEKSKMPTSAGTGGHPSPSTSCRFDPDVPDSGLDSYAMSDEYDDYDEYDADELEDLDLGGPDSWSDSSDVNAGTSSGVHCSDPLHWDDVEDDRRRSRPSASPTQGQTSDSGSGSDSSTKGVANDKGKGRPSRKSIWGDRPPLCFKGTSTSQSHGKTWIRGCVRPLDPMAPFKPPYASPSPSASGASSSSESSTTTMTKFKELNLLRWSYVISYAGADRWQLEGVQVGETGVFGIWGSVDRDEEGPAGPFWYWKQ